jgi:nicotinamidase-related amidase
MDGNSAEQYLTATSVHLCIDMQRLFSSEGPWPTPWMERVLPRVASLAERFAARTIFTRFMTPTRPEKMSGTWRTYYEKWRETTRDRLDHRLLELMPPLSSFAPPAIVIDKPVYSAFSGRHLHEYLSARNVDTLIVTGAETDVCVLATVLGAVDRGYRVLIVEDAVCSSSDQGHETLLQLFATRYDQQIGTTTTAEILRSWR